MKSAIIENGVVRNIIVGSIPGSIDLTGLDPQPQIGWLYDGETFSAPPEPDPVPVDLGTLISLRAFIRRLGPADYNAAAAAAETDGTTRYFLKVAEGGSTVDLAHADTIAGLNHLESEGTIAAGRADTILNTPVTAEELP